ncbi:MAG: GNAT superfamily N-acetyltransferase [Candidatus Azotimanducaceae bacterium]|jgi:GNAT superfamily N-acetyltransferase
MNPPKILIAKEANRDQVIQSIVIGFSTDPLGRWFWPTAKSYLLSAPCFDAYGGRSIDNGSAYTTENYEGVALWLPPGVDPDEERMIPLLEISVSKDILEDVFAVFEAMDEYHPKEPCWYLPLIAVDPFYQGKGIGSQLMKHALARIDREALPAHLVSSNPRNISLYERHGFEAMGQIQIGTSPTVTPMIRHPK